MYCADGATRSWEYDEAGSAYPPSTWQALEERVAVALKHRKWIAEEIEKGEDYWIKVWGDYPIDRLNGGGSLTEEDKKIAHKCWKLGLEFYSKEAATPRPGSL